MTLTDFYRKNMPIQLRYYIGKLRTHKFERQLFKRVCNGEWDNDYRTECDYMRSKGRIETFPYAWTEAYDKNEIEVFYDTTEGMRYVLVDGKRLFFPRRYPPSYIRTYFNTIRIEQDSRSAHYYFDPKDDRLNDVTFVDVGAAEGFISLRVADRAKAIILFESDSDWLEALEATFKPWKDKTTIINKYANDHNDKRSVRIDDAIVNKEKVVLKLDVEGMEQKVLSGAGETLKKSDTKVFVCTYHNLQDDKNLKDNLVKYHFHVEQSDSLMFYGYEDASFRRGVLRAWQKL